MLYWNLNRLIWPRKIKSFYTLCKITTTCQVVFCEFVYTNTFVGKSVDTFIYGHICHDTEWTDAFVHSWPKYGTFICWHICAHRKNDTHFNVQRIYSRSQNILLAIVHTFGLIFYILSITQLCLTLNFSRNFIKYENDSFVGHKFENLGTY